MHSNTFVYTPKIPSSKAHTKGYGDTRDIYVIRCDLPENFKTLNSLTLKRVGPWKKWKIGRARFDYGLLKGKSGNLMAYARDFAKMVDFPEERTTREEF